jgi:radical SAM superfamily enzyme YgiQ (UPF0313 family)
MARVLFIAPPVRLNAPDYDYLIHWPRHALVIAAEIQDRFECSLLDITAEFLRRYPQSSVEATRTVLGNALSELVLRRIEDYAPDLIAVHAHAAPHLPVVHATLSAIDRAGATCPIVVGGMAASQMSRELDGLVPERLRPLTWIVRGEATGRAEDVLDLVLERRSLNEHRESTQTHTSGVRELLLLENPHALTYPRPRFDLLDGELYRELFQNGQFVPHLEMTSGCTFGCTFCGVHYPGAARRFRKRSVAAVIDELKHLRSTFGFDEFYFCDETFTLDMKLAADLCRAVTAEGLAIRWRCVTRVDRIDESLVKLMAEAGCYEIGFGTESANDEILVQIDKHATVDRNRSAIELVQRHGIDANALTIIGLPHEDHSDIRRTFDFLARDAKPNRSQIFIFHPVPGTEYFTNPSAHGLHLDIDSIEDWYRWDHIGTPVCDTRMLSREDVVRYFLLFNRALSTVADPEPDPALIKRLLENRFPVRRKGVSWISDANGIVIHRESDPANDILESIEGIDGRDSEDESRLAAILEFVLSRCSGSSTEAEIAEQVERVWSLTSERARTLTSQALQVLQQTNLVTDF